MITIFTDASYCQQTGAAGWGAWAKADGWPHGVQFGEPFMARMDSAGEAEICGIAKALYWLHRMKHLVDHKIMLQSDCERALVLIAMNIRNVTISDHIAGHKLNIRGHKIISPRERDAINYIRNFAHHGIAVRHVYGHQNDNWRSFPVINGKIVRPGTPEENTRFTINRICDRIARRNMKKARGDISAA